MKQYLIGTYEMGHVLVDLFLMEGEDGGCFYFTPDEKSLPRIKVGMGFPTCYPWNYLVSILLHEAIEFSLTRRELRYIPSGKLTNGHDGYTFIFSHDQFTQVCAEVGEFMTKALPDLCRKYRGLKSTHRRRKRKG